MANGNGFNKLLNSFDTLGKGGGAVGHKIKDTVVGGGHNGARVGKGLLGFGQNVADTGAGITGSVVGGVGNFAQKYPGVAAVVALALAYKPVKHFIDKLRGKKGNNALASQNDILALQAQNSELRAMIAQNRQNGAMTSATLGAANPGNANAVGRLQASRTTGLQPPFNN